MYSEEPYLGVRVLERVASLFFECTHDETSGGHILKTK